NVNPQEYDPAALFSRLFGDGFVEPGETPVVDPTLRIRRNILDAVRLDANRLKTRLGATDKARLDQHLEGVASLQARIEALENNRVVIGAACARPPEPAVVSTET